MIDSHGIGHAVAVRENNVLKDLFIDPISLDFFYPPYTLLKVNILRRVKERGGYFIKLPNAREGFLLTKNVYSEGVSLIVMARNLNEKEKLQRFSDKVKLETKYFVIEKGNRKVLFSKRVTNSKSKVFMKKILRKKLLEYGKEVSIIVRSSIDHSLEQNLEYMLEYTLSCFEKICNHLGQDGDQVLGFLSKEKAMAVYGFDKSYKIIDRQGVFELSGVWDQIDVLKNKRVFFGNSSYLNIEQTSAFCSIDINTGSDLFIEAHRVNLEACETIADNLRLRAIGGKVVIDFLPCSSFHKDQIFKKLDELFRLDIRKHIVFGWSKGGNFEVEISRDRVPLNIVLDY